MNPLLRKPTVSTFQPSTLLDNAVSNIMRDRIGLNTTTP